jgi:hypothetical protein
MRRTGGAPILRRCGTSTTTGDLADDYEQRDHAASPNAWDDYHGGIA